MDRDTVMVINWICGPLLVLATIILIWKMVSEKLQGKAFSSDLITTSLVLAVAVIGMIQLNIDRGLWLQGALLVIQLVITLFLLKRLWSPLLQKLRG